MRVLSRRAIGVGLAALAACGTARVLHQTPYEGVIELQGDHNKAMEQANEEMAAHCGLSNFTVVHDGFESTDAAPTADAQTEHPEAAWRVHYECGSGPPTAAAPPAPGYR
ncbi:MAG: hypothetical protein E6J91_46895 [Deltaproteobacteria bacterium]|nr:MAG: hypothetical protein E6J91_46895 [Deltaproteobacteria bacterium]